MESTAVVKLVTQNMMNGQTIQVQIYNYILGLESLGDFLGYRVRVMDYGN